MSYFNTYRGSKSLPRKRPKSPATPVPFKSANPGHLGEFSVTRLDYADESGAELMANGACHVSPFRTRTMKEYDQQISELKKENFSLKLRIYFLEEKMQQKFSGYDNGGDIYKANIELKVELESLRIELADKQELLLTASKALESLESHHQAEIHAVKLKVESERHCLEQRITELEKNFQKVDSANCDEPVRASNEWFRKAFSIADLTSSDNENSENVVSSLQQKLSELEATVVQLNCKITAYENKIQSLESSLESKESHLKTQAQDHQKKTKTIHGLLEIINEKSKECDNLSKKMKLQTDELKRLKEEINCSAKNETTSGELHLTRKQQEGRSSILTSEQHSTLLGDLETKDNKIRDLYEQLNQLQVKINLNVEDCLSKDQTIFELQNTVLSAERKAETLLAKCNSLMELEKTVVELKTILSDKDDMLKNVQEKFNRDMAEKSSKLASKSTEIDKMRNLVKELEESLKSSKEEQISIANQSSDSKNDIFNLKKELAQRDDLIEHIKDCLEKVLLEDMKVDPDATVDVEKVTSQLYGIAKLRKLLQEIGVLSAKDVDNVCNEDQKLTESVVASSSFSSSLQLHHLDLIRDSHQQESVVSLLSANMHLKKLVKSLQLKLSDSLQSNKTSQEQLNVARRQSDFFTQQNVTATKSDGDKITCCTDEITAKDAKGTDTDKLAVELKDGKIKHNGSNELSEEVVMAPVSPKSSNKVSKAEVNEAQAEISRLRFLLSSTEATVRMLGSKVKYYRVLLKDMGISPLSTNKANHLSDTNLEKLFKRKENVASAEAFAEETSEAFNGDNRQSALFGSSSAPVTPMKGLSPAADANMTNFAARHVHALQSEIAMLKLCIEQKDSLLGALQLEIERCSPLNLHDVACQTVTVNLDRSQRKSTSYLSPDTSAWRHIAESHRTSELLRTRLEELAEFLECLLQFDENGLLDLSCITPEKVASIRGYLEQSRELSCSLSQSLIALDKTTLLSETLDPEQSFAAGPISQCMKCSSNEEDDGCMTLVSSPVDGLVDKDAMASKRPRERKGCSASLLMDGSISDEQVLSANNFLLLLKPLSDKNGDSLVAAVNDELPTCSLTFGPQGSFLSSTNLGDVPRGKNLGSRQHSLSESDSWSEPDRGISQQRIGLDTSQLTPASKLSPRHRDFLTSSSTDSEFVTECGSSPGRLRSSKATDRRLSNSQELHLLSQVQELKDINGSLRAELNLYQNVCNSKNSPGMRGSSASVKTPRRGRTRSGDTSIASAPADNRPPAHILYNYLQEISALRKQLEISIEGYDHLREQFEQRLASSGDSDGVIRDLYAQLEECGSEMNRKDAALCRVENEKSHLLAEIQELTEKFESYRETIESLQSMLEEQQRCSRDTGKKMENLEGLLSERDRALAESIAAREQLEESMAKARQLLNENEAVLRQLQGVNEGLQRQCDNMNADLEKQRRYREMVDGLNGQVDQLQKSIEADKEMMDAQKDDNAILHKRIGELEHGLSIKEEQVKGLLTKVDSQNSVHEQEFADQHKLITKLHVEMAQLKSLLEAASTINNSFKTELQMYEKLNSSPCDGLQRDDPTETGVPQLMTEIRSLRLQLERSIEANQALRMQLEKKTREPLHLEIGVSDQCPSSMSSPETASSFSYTSHAITSAISWHREGDPGRVTSVERQISKSSDYVSDNQKESNENSQHVSEMATDTGSVYSSPDLGIESDRSRFSSLDRSSAGSYPKGQDALQKRRYLEPGIPGNGDWNVINSAPPKIVGGQHADCSLVPVGNNLNFTFPTFKNNLRDIGEITGRGESISIYNAGKPYYVTLPEDYGLLRKGVAESLNVLQAIRSKAKERLLQLRKGSTVAVGDGEYIGWKEVYTGCNALKASLQKSCQLVGQFWAMPLPLIPTPSSESHSMSLSNKENPLEVKLMKLYHELAKERERAEDALGKLEACNRLKIGMEKAILKQLNKTHTVLKQAKGNLEQQQQVKSISSSGKQVRPQKKQS